MRKSITMFLSVAAACAMMLSGCTSTKTSDATKDQQEQQAAWESYSESMASRDVVAEKVPDSNAPEVYMVTIYVPKKDGSGLNEIVDDIDNKTGDALFNKLKEHGAVPENITLTGYSEKDGTASIQLTGAEELSDIQKQAIAETFAENFSLTGLTVLADDITIIEETFETEAPAGPGVQ